MYYIMSNITYILLRGGALGAGTKSNENYKAGTETSGWGATSVVVGGVSGG